MAKMTRHTMAAAKMVAKRQGEAQALNILTTCGTKTARAIAWLDKWSGKDLEKFQKQLLDIPF